MRYRYEVYVVSGAEYAKLDLGEPFRDGQVMDGLGGMNDDCLVVVAHPVEDDFTLLCTVPAGWTIRFRDYYVVAMHPDHEPRVAHVRDLPQLVFDEWPTVGYLDADRRINPPVDEFNTGYYDRGVWKPWPKESADE